MKFPKPSKQSITVTAFLLLMGGFTAVAVNYEQHQRPFKYSDLPLESKGEHHRISTLLREIEKDSANEDKEIYLAFKTRGEVKQKTKSVMFNSEYQDLLKEREELFNPPSRKIEGFGYAILSFLGFVK